MVSELISFGFDVASYRFLSSSISSKLSIKREKNMIYILLVRLKLPYFAALVKM